MEVGDDVRRVLAIQEERIAQYGRLKSAQDGYSSQQWSLGQYQSMMTEVTQKFASLSKEVISLIDNFRERGLEECVSILEDIQTKEKEKLELTAKWQIRLQESKLKEDGEEEDEEEEDFGASEHEKRELRKKLLLTEAAIADLIRDLRYECEPYLLGQQNA